MRCIIHSNLTTQEYFFSTDHCQGVKEPGKTTYPKGFIPTTWHLPMPVVARPSLPSGWVETVEDVVKVFFHDETEIPNPDPSYQVRSM